jgi:hypothetical protein
MREVAEMIVCGHGNVTEFCRNNGMTVAAQYTGKITDYDGDIKVIVTDTEMCLQEFFYLRMVMLAKGYDVRSVHYPELDEKLNSFVEYVEVQERIRRKQTYGGRQPFGYRRVRGRVRAVPEVIAMARKIIELRDEGKTLREIYEAPEVHHPDGRKISISTIQQIVKNRDKYIK